MNTNSKTKENTQRVGIITYTDSLNWGAQLQAFALKAAIDEQHGFEAQQIDHRDLNINLYRKGKSPKIIINNIAAFMHKKAFYLRVERTLSFRKNFLSMTEPCRNSNDMLKLNDEFELFITGSDQVWNTSLGINTNFYLDFVTENFKKCAYAASFGVTSVATQFVPEVRRRLLNYRYITVRETAGKEILKNVCDREVSCVCDPVFLRTAEQWEKEIICASKATIPASPYIFVYSTDISSEFLKMVYGIKKKYKLPLISVTWMPGAKVIKDAGPAEFIDYVRNAELVVTTSFHAVAFSTIFHRKLAVMPHKITGNRIYDILKRLGGESQIVRNPVQANITEIDYELLDHKLEEYRKKSYTHLRNILTGKTSLPAIVPDRKDVTITQFHSECTGCRTCSLVCPRKCISMESDSNGFVYPCISMDKCISCYK